MRQVVRRRCFAEGLDDAGRFVLQKFETRTFRAAQTRDADASARDAAQQLLFAAVVETVSNHGETKFVAIECDAAFHIRHDDCRVIDPAKKGTPAMPARFAFVSRERNQLEEMAVRVAEVERADLSGIEIPIGQGLHAGGNDLRVVTLKLRISGIDIGNDDGDVLKRLVVRRKIARNGTALRLGMAKDQCFFAELQLCAGGVRIDCFELQHVGVEGEGTREIGDIHLDRFHLGRRVHRERQQECQRADDPSG